jgi:hypothetical protein
MIGVGGWSADCVWGRLRLGGKEKALRVCACVLACRACPYVMPPPPHTHPTYLGTPLTRHSLSYDAAGAEAEEAFVVVVLVLGEEEMPNCWFCESVYKCVCVYVCVCVSVCVVGDQSPARTRPKQNSYAFLCVRFRSALLPGFTHIYIFIYMCVYDLHTYIGHTREEEPAQRCCQVFGLLCVCGIVIVMEGSGVRLERGAVVVCLVVLREEGGAYMCIYILYTEYTYTQASIHPLSTHYPPIHPLDKLDYMK